MSRSDWSMGVRRKFSRRGQNFLKALQKKIYGLCHVRVYANCRKNRLVKWRREGRSLSCQNNKEKLLVVICYEKLMPLPSSRNAGKIFCLWKRCKMTSFRWETIKDYQTFPNGGRLRYRLGYWWLKKRSAKERNGMRRS